MKTLEQKKRMYEIEAEDRRQYAERQRQVNVKLAEQERWLHELVSRFSKCSHAGVELPDSVRGGSDL